jgi:hypothetical protein
LAADQISTPAFPGDEFARVLGTRRGSGGARDDTEAELSSAERARAFLAWAKHTHFENRLDYHEAERETANALGIELVYGRWTEDPDGDHAPRRFPMAAIFRDAEPVGFWDLELDRLLIYDTHAPREVR